MPFYILPFKPFLPLYAPFLPLGIRRSNYNTRRRHLTFHLSPFTKKKSARPKPSRPSPTEKHPIKTKRFLTYEPRII